MPAIGELKRASELGYHNDGHNYRWRACIDCGKESWALVKNDKTASHCRSCASKMRWNKIERSNAHIENGYVLIRLPPDSFYLPMTDYRGYVREHRLVMAQYLGRCLNSWEIIHHRNGDKLDNRLENLQLVSELGHRQMTLLEMKIAKLEKRIVILEAENKGLRSPYH